MKKEKIIEYFARKEICGSENREKDKDISTFNKSFASVQTLSNKGDNFPIENDNL